MKVLSLKIHLKKQAFKNIFKIESGIMRVYASKDIIYFIVFLRNYATLCSGKYF